MSWKQRTEQDTRLISSKIKWKKIRTLTRRHYYYSFFFFHRKSRCEVCLKGYTRKYTVIVFHKRRVGLRRSFDASALSISWWQRQRWWDSLLGKKKKRRNYRRKRRAWSSRLFLVRRILYVRHRKYVNYISMVYLFHSLSYFIGLSALGWNEKLFWKDGYRGCLFIRKWVFMIALWYENEIFFFFSFHYLYLFREFWYNRKSFTEQVETNNKIKNAYGGWSI